MASITASNMIRTPVLASKCSTRNRNIRGYTKPLQVSTQKLSIAQPLQARTSVKVARRQVSRLRVTASELPSGPALAVPVVGAAVLNAGMGSIYAWSLFVMGLETALGMPRATISTAFSCAMVSFAAVMFCGSDLHTWMPTSVAGALAMLTAGAGLILAGTLKTYPGLMVGFGVLYGAAVGIGYGVALGTANLAKSSKGLITGIIVASFATTPVFLAPILKASIAAVGSFATMQKMGMVTCALSLVVFACFKFSGVQIPKAKALALDAEPIKMSTILTLWAGFCTGCAGGLMIIAHATGVTAAFGGSAMQMGLAVQYGAIGNWCGRIAAGIGCDLFGPKKVIALAALATAAALASLQMFFQGNPAAVMAALVVVGTGYGCTLTSYAALVRRMVGADQFGKWYGRVFTAYGVAGLSSPIIAGVLFDKSGNYAVSLFLAAAATLVSVGMLTLLPDYKE